MSVIEQAYSKWCQQRFPLPTERDISELEQRITVRFRDHYRMYLLEWNGGIFSEPDIVARAANYADDRLLWLNGIHASADYAELGSAFDLALFEDNSPPIVQPIGRTTANDLIMMSTAYGDEDDGTIFVRTIGQDNIYLGDTMEDFFQHLRDREV